MLTLHLPEHLQADVAAQAARAGMSLEHYVALILAERVGAQAETVRYFSARAARTEPGAGFAVLGRAGIGNPAREDDLMPIEG